MSTRQGPPSRDRSVVESDDVQFQVAATNLIRALFVMMKVALLHDMSNKAVLPAVQRFRLALEAYQRQCGPEAALQFVGDAAYVGRRLVRADLDTWEKARFLKEFFGRMELAEIAFQGEVGEAGLRQFIQAARQASLEPSTVSAFRRGAYQGIAVRDLEAAGTSAGDDALAMPDRLRVLRAYGIVVVCIRELLERLRAGDKAPLLPIRRAMQDFVHLPETSAAQQVGLLALPQYREELGGRLANIGILTVMMGRRIGLAAAELRELGVTAALGLVGRALRPELEFAPVDECIRRGAYLEGVRRLLPYSGQGRAAGLRLVVAAGLSSPEARRAGHPLVRLVAVSEAYDLLTQKPPKGAGLQPEAALSRLVGSDEVDRAAARLLVCTVGLFPVGSMVRLSTGETAMVIDVPGSDALEQPRVMVVTDPAGQPAQHRVVDLVGSGAMITGTIDAEQIDLNVGHFIFG